MGRHCAIKMPSYLSVFLFNIGVHRAGTPLMRAAPFHAILKTILYILLGCHLKLGKGRSKRLNILPKGQRQVSQPIWFHCPFWESWHYTASHRWRVHSTFVLTPPSRPVSQNLTSHKLTYFSSWDNGHSVALVGLKFMILLPWTLSSRIITGPTTVCSGDPFINAIPSSQILFPLGGVNREGGIGKFSSSGIIEPLSLQMEFPFWSLLPQPLQHKQPRMTKLKPPG